jgi:hypothetical protein
MQAKVTPNSRCSYWHWSAVLYLKHLRKASNKEKEQPLEGWRLASTAEPPSLETPSAATGKGWLLQTFAERSSGLATRTATCDAGGDRRAAEDGGRTGSKLPWPACAPIRPAIPYAPAKRKRQNKWAEWPPQVRARAQWHKSSNTSRAYTHPRGGIRAGRQAERIRRGGSRADQRSRASSPVCQEIPNGKGERREAGPRRRCSGPWKSQRPRHDAWWWVLVVATVRRCPPTYLPSPRCRSYRPLTCGPHHLVGSIVSETMAHMQWLGYQLPRLDARWRPTSGFAPPPGGAPLGSTAAQRRRGPVPITSPSPRLPRPTGHGFDFSCLPATAFATSLT